MATSAPAQPDTDPTLSETILSLPNGISIRTYRTTDAASIAHHADNRALWRNMRDAFPSPYTLQAAHEWIGLQLEPSKSWHPTSLPDASSHCTEPATKMPTNYVIALNDSAIGGIGLKPGTDIECRTCELGYWLSEEHSGKGITSIAAKAFVDWTFDTFPSIVRVHAEIFHWNKASMRVVEKCGLEKEAVKQAALYKEGKLGDLVCYARIREGLEY